ncbi:hypothetical protein N9777_05150 [Ascidiaceihabitans sp.]|nr:hypothetical protein [Ascidiaceihabitans sp.]
MIAMLYRLNQPAKHLTLVLLMISIPNISKAEKQCIKGNENSKFCQYFIPLNTSDNLKEIQNSSALALYYSGGILSNLQPSVEPKKQLETVSLANTKLTVDTDEQFSETSEPNLNTTGLYRKIRKRFRNLDLISRKKIQKCLLHGSYQGNIDGLWGTRTFQAIVNYEDDLNTQSAEEGVHTFKKVQEFFSGVKNCKRLVMDTFES